MSDPRRATLVGTGLIGGSIGLALRRAGWAVMGTDRDPDRAEAAVAHGALDAVGEDATSDLTIVATPVGAVAAEARRLLDAGHRVVTDVGSVKAPLVAAVDHPGFVGGHPMAGSEQEGIAAATADLFDGATWVLTPTATTDDQAYATVRAAIVELGAEVVALDPARHDALVAEVSHVPHLTAATLMRLADDTAEEHRALLRLAAGGFRDMTRVAAGHPGIWPDICVENQAAIVDVLDRLITGLSEVRQVVADQDRAQLMALLEQARSARTNLPARFGRPSELGELRVIIPDRPGALAEVTTLATEIDVNIANMEIAHSSEGDRGVLILIVEAKELGRLHDALVERGFVVSHQAGARVVASLTVGPSGPLRGRLRMPGDKSISHRALLLAALAEGRSRIEGLSDGADVTGTRGAIEALGAATDDEDGAVVVDGGTLREPADVIDVGNSGTTIRLLTGLCSAFPFLTVLAGDESIARRPMDRVAVPLRLMGASIEGREGGRLPPLSVRGGELHGITYRTPVPSAQVKSAVLLAGLGAEGDTVVEEDVPTRAHTEELLARFGADVDVSEGGIRVRRSRPEPFAYTVPGDPSQAAFWVVAATLVPGSDLVVEDLYLGPARTGYLDVLARMGADIEVERDADAGTGTVRVRAAALHGTSVVGAEIVGLDEVPALAVAAAAAEGTTRFVDVGELRVKESDRLATVSGSVRAVGGTAEVDGDALVIEGGTLQGGHIDAHGDHRIAMAAAVAGLASAGEAVTVEGWDAVATSYPRFEQDLGECTP